MKKEVTNIQIENSVATMKQLLRALRESYQKITIGFPEEFQVKFKVEGEEVRVETDDNLANGYLRTYKAFCNYFDTYANPSFMQFIIDLVDSDSVHLNFNNCPGNLFLITHLFVCFHSNVLLSIFFFFSRN